MQGLRLPSTRIEFVIANLQFATGNQTSRQAEFAVQIADKKFFFSTNSNTNSGTGLAQYGGGTSFEKS